MTSPLRLDDTGASKASHRIRDIVAELETTSRAHDATLETVGRSVSMLEEEKVRAEWGGGWVAAGTAVAPGSLRVPPQLPHAPTPRPPPLTHSLPPSSWCGGGRCGCGRRCRRRRRR
jgi:hypothetical protein